MWRSSSWFLLPSWRLKCCHLGNTTFGAICYSCIDYTHTTSVPLNTVAAVTVFKMAGAQGPANLVRGVHLTVHSITRFSTKNLSVHDDHVSGERHVDDTCTSSHHTRTIFLYSVKHAKRENGNWKLWVQYLNQFLVGKITLTAQFENGNCEFWVR